MDMGYDYGSKIEQPGDIGMSNRSSIDAISSNIGGLLSYIQVLINGGGDASKVDGPMGPKFFVQTPTKCKDRDGNDQDRFIYLNYVPTGTLPVSVIMPNMPGISTNYRGLLPGIIENIGHLSPVQIMDTIVMDTGNACTLLKMETIDDKNIKKAEEHYVSDNDIRRMDATWFSDVYPKPRLPPPVQTKYDDEGFENYGYNYSDVFSSVSDSDFKGTSQCKNIYLNLLGLIGIYIVMKIMLGGKAH